MESNKNNGNNNGGDQHQHQQLRSARKRTFNELENDGDQPAAAGEEEQKEPEECSSKKNLEEVNYLDLELENLSREEFIKLVRKQMTTTMEAQKQMETAKKEAEESAKQAEEFSQRNIQLEKEKAEVHAELGKMVSEIVEMHKEVEEKSEEIAEKAKQIDELLTLTQLNEHTSHQHQMQTEQEMKIQLSLETWYDWLAFVPRHRLGKIVPQIGDRKFASIAQKFLHGYGEIKIGHIQIVAPYEEDPDGHPRVRVWQNCRYWRFEMAETQMPANITNFKSFKLRYFDQSVLKFMQKFQQNGLFDNVNLVFDKVPSKDILHQALSHLLPLINGIVLIDVKESAQMADFYDAANSKEIHELNMKMMEETRILAASYDPENLHAKTVDLYCRWLYQTARVDGKPRVLVLGRLDVDYSPISFFIERIRQDFLMATEPVTFFIRIDLPKAFKPQEDICLENGKTKERLMTKMEEADLEKWETFVLLISRHPIASTNKWIVSKAINDKIINLSKELKVVPV